MPKKIFNRAKKSQITKIATGTVVGGVVLGSIFIYRRSFDRIPVVGPVITNAANGLNGSSIPQRVF